MTTATTALPRRIPRPRPLVGFRALLVSEARLLRRNPALVVWVALIPVVASIVLGSLPATTRSIKDLDGLSWFTSYQPILVMFSMVLLSVQVLPDVLTRYREQGILKRLRTTPASPASLLAAQVVLTFAVEFVVTAIMIVVPACVRAPLPKNLAGFVLAFVVAAACMLSIGMVLASVFRNNKVASAVGTVLFFALQFFAGLWIPRATMPDWLRYLSDATPSGAAVGALTNSLHGGWPGWAHLGVLLAWTIVLGALSVRLFRWE